MKGDFLVKNVKKILSFLLSFVLLSSMLTYGTLASEEGVEPVEAVAGDVNGDGEVDLKDLLTLRKYLANYNYSTKTSTFEVSAGPIIRGLKEIPYPNPRFLSVIKECGGKVILSSDAHAPEKIAYNFPALLALVRDAGFEKISRFANGQLVEDPIDTL